MYLHKQLKMLQSSYLAKINNKGVGDHYTGLAFTLNSLMNESINYIQCKKKGGSILTRKDLGFVHILNM